MIRRASRPLTVAALEPDAFSVALIPHTLGTTTLESLAPGEHVNLEVDLLAKYVERMLQLSRGEALGQGGGITEAWLRERGFI